MSSTGACVYLARRMSRKELTNSMKLFKKPVKSNLIFEQIRYFCKYFRILCILEYFHINEDCNVKWAFQYVRKQQLQAQTPVTLKATNEKSDNCLSRTGEHISSKVNHESKQITFDLLSWLICLCQGDL